MNIRLVTGLLALAVGLAVPAAVSARPFTPHHTSPHYGHTHHHGHVGHRTTTTKAERMRRRANTHRFGNPNARNPEREGYQQQLGNTTNGPRY